MMTNAVDKTPVTQDDIVQGEKGLSHEHESNPLDGVDQGKPRGTFSGIDGDVPPIPPL